MNVTNPFSGILDIFQGNNFNPSGDFNLGFRLVIHKAGQWANSKRAKNIKIYHDRKTAWQKLGGMWGSYLLPFSGVSPEDLFTQWQACDTDPKILRAIDWEDGGNGAADQKTVRALARLVEKEFKFLPVIYGSDKLTEMRPDGVLEKCPLWYANPNGGTVPTVFAPKHPPAGRIVFWQFSEDGDAITKPFDGGDLNAFDGTLEQLQSGFPFFPPTTS